MVISGISPRFRGLSQSEGQITHVLLTRSPLVYPQKGLTARLACVKHAASVRPEPGSNSPSKKTPSTENNPRQKQQHYPCQKNRTTPTNPNTQSQPAPTGRINSSTFNTLLRSQTSHAHHNANHQPTPQGNQNNLPDNPDHVKTHSPANQTHRRPSDHRNTRERETRGSSQLAVPRVTGLPRRHPRRTSTPATVRLPLRRTTQRPWSRAVEGSGSSASRMRSLFT